MAAPELPRAPGGWRPWLAIGLAALGLGAAWVALRPKPPRAERLVVRHPSMDGFGKPEAQARDALATTATSQSKVDGIPASGGQPRLIGKHPSGKVHFDVLAKLLADDRRSAPPDAWRRELLDPRAPSQVRTRSHPLLGRPAPDFTLQDHRGRPWNLYRRLAHGPIVLVFYLGYSCVACVHHLFELDADRKRFHRLGGEVAALSGDSPAFTRGQFEKFGGWGFPVLSDPGHAAARSYGMFRTEGQEELLHGTFLIGPDGRVRWVQSGDAPFRNNKALLYELARLRNKP
jgi:peroxiredoxin